jgi:DNA-binding MarR family transcriptional regulator
MKRSPSTSAPARRDETAEILLALSRLIGNLTRVSGAGDDSPSTTATQRLALFELGQGTSLRLHDLAERMGVSAPTASRSVDALHEHGLVERAVDPDARRAVRVGLTPAGTRLLEERKAKAKAALAPAVAALSETERATLTELLRRMTDAVRDERQA